MALRAGYYGLKRGIREKLLKLLDAVPEGIGPDNPIASKSDVLTAVDLLDDTVGWVSKNKANVKTINVDNWNGMSISTDANNRYTINGTNNYDGTAGREIIGAFNDYSIAKFKAGETLVFTGINNANISVGSISTSGTYKTLQKDTPITLTEDIGCIYLGFAKNATFTDEVVSFMVCDAVVYSISPSFEPYHVSVEEALTTKLDVNNPTLSAITDLKGKIPNAFDIYDGFVSNTIMGVLTNNVIGVVGKINAYHLRTSGNANYIDWFAMAGADTFVIGRYDMDNDAYVSHMVLTQTNREISAALDTRESSVPEPEPVTREASEPAELPIEEEPVTVKKTTRKKSTAAADTEKEGE